MKKISHALILILLSFSIQSFEDIYLQCGKKEGYFNIIFSVTQSWDDYFSSIGRSDEEGDYLTIKIATNKFNNFMTDDYLKGKTYGNLIGTFEEEANYWIDRTTGKAYINSTKFYSDLGSIQAKLKRDECREKEKESGSVWSFCSLYTYNEKTSLGNCSKISHSEAKKYAKQLYTPPKKAKRKF